MNNQDYVNFIANKDKLKSLKVKLYPRFYGTLFHDYVMNYYFLNYKELTNVVVINAFKRDLYILGIKLNNVVGLDFNYLEMLAVNCIDSNLPFKRWLYED